VLVTQEGFDLLVKRLQKLEMDIEALPLKVSAHTNGNLCPITVQNTICFSAQIANREQRGRQLVHIHCVIAEGLAVIGELKVSFAHEALSPPAQARI
jgi:hypothetical protein